ncbi:MAG: CopD family protein [Hydrocarboniphaga effusa]|nr:CopD family protein [Hydrocarboniphaga effusa]
MGFAMLAHVLAATVWVGGMFFALVCLRPAAAGLEPAPRLQLWEATLRRFFPWVLMAVLVLLLTGLWMIFSVLGGVRAVGLHVHIMLGLGVLMMLLALHVYFAPFKRLRKLVADAHWTDAGKNLHQIRLSITVNLVLGLCVTAVASGGRYFFH